MAFIYESLVPKGFDNPPNRLHIIRFHSFIVMIKIDPSAEASYDLAPFFYIPKDRASAGLIEFGNAIALNVGL